MLSLFFNILSNVEEFFETPCTLLVINRHTTRSTTLFSRVHYGYVSIFGILCLSLMFYYS